MLAVPEAATGEDDGQVGWISWKKPVSGLARG